MAITIGVLGNISHLQVGSNLIVIGEGLTPGTTYFVGLGSGSTGSDTPLFSQAADSNGTIFATFSSAISVFWNLQIHTTNQAVANRIPGVSPYPVTWDTVGSPPEAFFTHYVGPINLIGFRGDTKNLLMWDPAAILDPVRLSTAASYTLSRSVTSPGTSGFSSILGPGSSNLTFVDTGRTNGTNYWYRATAQAKFLFNRITIDSFNSNTVKLTPWGIRQYVGQVPNFPNR